MELNEPCARYLRFSNYEHTELGVLPSDWPVVEIGSIADTSSGTTPPRAQYDRFYKSGTHPWVKTLDLNNGEIRFTDESVTDSALEDTSLRLFPVGSVLVAMYGGLRQIGRTGLLRIPAAVNQAITAIRPQPNRVCPEFLLLYLNHRVGYWQSVASSSRKDPNITGADVRAFRLPLPTLGEQQRIADALTDADALIDSLEQLLTKKRQIKQGAMQELLTGKRRLPGFATNWRCTALGNVVGMKSGEAITSDGLSDSYSFPCYGGNGLRGYAESYTHDGTFALIGRQGALCGNVTLAQGKLFASEHAVVVTPSESIDIVWLHFVLIRMNLNRHSESSAQPGLSVEKLLQLEVLIPEQEEQVAIGKTLSDMDAAITALEARLTKARALKQAMAQALLTGRIRLVEPTE